MLYSLFSVVIGMVLLLLGIAAGTFSLVQGLFLLFVNIPISNKLLKKKVLLSATPLVRDLGTVAILALALALVTVLVAVYLPQYFPYFVAGVVIMGILSLLTLKSDDNIVRYITSYRNYIRPEYLKDGSKDLPAERVLGLINVETEEFE